MPPIRVLIADDESLMRHALSVFVNSADGMTVVGEAADGAACVQMSSALRPDVVLMDMQMPIMNGVDATLEVLAKRPETRVIALTTFTSERYLIPALRAGATAYLVKDTEPDTLIAAIRDVCEGSYVISPQVTRELVESVSKSPRAAELVPLSEDESLSVRELDIVRLLAQGHSNAEIARELYISEATVKTHLGRVMAKWNVRDRVQTLIRATRAGVVDLR